MSVVIFPNPEETSEDGLLCVGGDLSVETLKSAYGQGIFPWPQEGYPLLWFCPPKRGVIDFSELHLPKSLKSFLKKQKDNYEVKVNFAFDQVIDHCSKVPRPGQSGTWILPEMIEAYKEFHREGFAHSFEIWQEEELVGGLYGVLVNGVFSGESMFYKKTNMSKVALIETIQYLEKKGFEWIDVQMVTEVLESLGGKYISRKDFLGRVRSRRDLSI